MSEADRLVVTCPNCQTRMQIKRMLAGTRIHCPNKACGSVIAVPELPAPPVAKPRPEPIVTQKVAAGDWLKEDLPRVDADWYYADRQQSFGPVPLRYLEQRVKSGQLKPADGWAGRGASARP